MLGIFLLYFIGKAYYNIKEQPKKGRWIYAIMGIASYYAGAFIGGFLIAIIIEIFDLGSVDSILIEDGI